MTSTRLNLMLAAGSVCVALALGIRHSFGLFLDPVSMANGWGRETFALAMAIQNLVWGLAQPVVGMLADRHGASRVIALGACLYAAGLALMAQPLTPGPFMLAAGGLIGLGLAGTTMPVIFGALARALPPERRSQAFGVTMAVAAFGQFAMLPGALSLLDGLGWARALLWLSALSAALLPLALLMRTGRPTGPPAPIPAAETVGAAFRQAMGSRDFWLLTTGFFVCGFQVVFIAVHLPAYLTDRGLPVSVGSTVLALIGLVNIAGTLGAGWLGARFAKPGLLAWIYLARGAAIAAFVYLPMSAMSAYAFGAAMGLFWLSTVPLTNAVVASLFGVRNLSMLGGLVFVGHQLGSFLGGWLGGAIYDRTGSYDIAWGMAIGLSLMAALLNFPVRETPLAERRASL
jgi:MFS family permease